MIKKSELLTRLKDDLRASDRLRTEWFNKMQEWKNETQGRPYGNEVKGKSRLVSMDIRKQLEWMIPTLADPFLSTTDIIKCSPITYEDVKIAPPIRVYWRADGIFFSCTNFSPYLIDFSLKQQC